MAWPTSIGVVDEQWQISFATRSSGPSFNGSSQVIQSLGDIWRATVTLKVPKALYGRWNALMAQKQGAAKTTNLGPVLHATYVTATGSTLHTAAVAGDTSLDVDVTDASAISDEAYLGLDGYLYQVHDVTTVSGTRVTIDIWPPVRADVAVSTGLDATPVAPMRIVTPTMVRATLGGVDEITVELEEELP